MRLVPFESSVHPGLLSRNAFVLAGSRGGGEGELVLGGGGVAGSGVLPGGHDQDGVLAEVAAPGIFLAVGVAFASPVVGAGLAQLREGDRVAAGFGEEVAAVAEHVGPLVERQLGCGGALAQFPASRNEPLVVSAAT